MSERDAFAVPNRPGCAVFDDNGLLEYLLAATGACFSQFKFVSPVI
jgi:hypothetical protein